MRFEDWTSAGAARRAAIARDSAVRISPDGIETGRRVYATSPRIEPYEIERVRSDLADGEISKFVSGIAGDESTVTTATRNHPKRCYKTSTSSGYSSHSPPLSAGSYSCYASASAKDPSYGCQRPIWPSIIYRHAEERNADYEGIYTCHMCGCAYSYSSSPLVSSLPRPSAREVLLELSRTLNSVIDSDVTMTPEDILRDISRIISLRLPSRNEYEYVSAPTMLNNKNLLSSYNGNVSSRVNLVNSKVYVDPRCLYGHNSARSVPLLQNKIRRCEETEKAGKSLGIAKKQPCEIPGPYVRKYLHGKHIESSCAKQSFRLDGDSKQCRNGLILTESQYSMQLECSDVGSSSEGTIASLTANDWNRRGSVKGLREDFDFTLDVARAERLGRAIARAKRKRQWCRILTILFGLAFFVLSVIIVSLSVTRGRKVFGSM